MAQSQTALYNIALASVGSDYTVASPSEQSIEAEICELFYEGVRQTALRAAHWNCAKRYSRLTEEVERDTSAAWTSTDPEPGYAFSYEIPANMLAARYLTTYQRFELGYETDQKIISCDIGGSTTPDDQPILCYTIDVTDVTLWEPDLYFAIAYALGAHISMPLHGKDARSARLVDTANGLIMQARANTANERQVMYQETPRRLRERGYTYSAHQPYIHPYGALFVAPGAPLV